MDRKIEIVLTKLISEKLGVDENEVRPESRFCEDLGTDSLDFVELIMEMEKTFNIIISDDENRRLETVLDAEILIATKLAS
jgi:acyl carrier protein